MRYTASNTPALADIKLVCNERIYKEALRQANLYGNPDMASAYADSFFTVPVRELAAGVRKLKDVGAAVAPAIFIGVQQGVADLPSAALYNLTAPISGNGYKFCAGSTVTRHSIQMAGYTVPEAELAKASDALLNLAAKRRQLHAKEAA